MQLEYLLWNGVNFKEYEIHDYLRKIAKKKEKKLSNSQHVKKIAIQENFGEIVQILDDNTLLFIKSSSHSNLKMNSPLKYKYFNIAKVLVQRRSAINCICFHPFKRLDFLIAYEEYA